MASWLMKPTLRKSGSGAEFNRFERRGGTCDVVGWCDFGVVNVRGMSGSIWKMGSGRGNVVRTIAGKRPGVFPLVVRW